MSLQLILFLQILLVSHVAAPFDYLCNVYKNVNYMVGYGEGQMDDFKIVIKRIFSSYNSSLFKVSKMDCEGNKGFNGFT